MKCQSDWCAGRSKSVSIHSDKFCGPCARRIEPASYVSRGGTLPIGMHKSKVERYNAIADDYRRCGSMAETAERFSTSRQRVDQILNTLNVERATSQHGDLDKILDAVVARCYELRSIPKAAAEFGVSQNTVYWKLREMGIRIKPKNDPEALFWTRIEKRGEDDC